MDQDSPGKKIEKRLAVAGWIVGVLPCVMLQFSATMKFARPPQVMEGFAHLGIPESLVLPLAIVEQLCTVAYLVPRTAMIGAILLTGYLGGAIFAHARLGEPVLVQILLGVMLWGGLYFRDRRVRRLIPIFTRPAA